MTETTIPEKLGNQLNVLQDLYNTEEDSALKSAFEKKILQIQEKILLENKPKITMPVKEGQQTFLRTDIVQRAEEAGFKFTDAEKQASEQFTQDNPLPPREIIVSLSDKSRLVFQLDEQGIIKWLRTLPGSKMKRFIELPWKDFERAAREYYGTSFVALEIIPQ